MTYAQALDYLASLAPRGWRLGLDRMQEFLRRADLSSSLGESGTPRYIHIAGTNGKGSVTAYVQSMLVESGYWTGAFFSPFVYDPRERIQFNRSYIPENVFAMLTQLMLPVGESLTDTDFGGITEFEFKTGLGFAFWKQLECEWVALETGLGGRLDATNVVTPEASVIVSISLDHTSILGNTEAEIAYEKAGIIKPGRPVVVGDVSQEAWEVIEAAAALVEAPVWRFGREVVLSAGAEAETYTVSTPAATHHDLHPGIRGAKQPHNMALAVAAMDVSGAGRTLRGYVDGCYRAYAPGRFEFMNYEGIRFLLDGAHNPEAARVLVQSLEEVVAAPIVLLTGMVAGHDPAHFYRELVDRVSSVHVVPIDFHRALPVSEVGASLRGLTDRVSDHSSLAEGLEAAMEDAGPTGLVLVTGSFYLVGEVGRVLRSVDL